MNQRSIRVSVDERVWAGWCVHQRFTHSIRDTKVKGHYMKVFDNAVKAATKYGRAISIRYDISSGGRDDYKDFWRTWMNSTPNTIFSVAPVPVLITANP